ncbi:MAG: polyprenyl synthetase family protein [Pseudomonadota bacterium]
MQIEARINGALRRAIAAQAGPACPPRLAEAIEYAVFPGGHRIRPRLCLAVANAFEDSDPMVVDAAMSSIELLHCASLVHDDMPCFDNAAMRRGKAAVHAAFGEPLALLCGDALIVLAFQTIARAAITAPHRASKLLTIVSDGVGAPNGIVAGQGWECEIDPPLKEYQRAKTGVLFAAATMAGAAAAGVDHSAWGILGQRIGEAYQIADDLLDRFGDPDVIGKPVGQDEANDRPNAVKELGVGGATQYLKRTIEEVVDSVPDCPGKVALRGLIRQEATSIMSAALQGRAAA